jgi:hypothetical protein
MRPATSLLQVQDDLHVLVATVQRIPEVGERDPARDQPLQPPDVRLRERSGDLLVSAAGWR